MGKLAARVAVVLALVASAPRARADIPPSPDSPDAHCTLKEQCPSGELCPYSFHPGKPPQPGEVPVGESCRAAAQAKGLERRCRNGSNYSGQELYCPKGETGSWTPPGQRSRCSAGAVGDAGDGAGAILLGGVALALLSRRRR